MLVSHFIILLQAEDCKMPFNYYTKTVYGDTLSVGQTEIFIITIKG